jgi:hypothetical protein
VVLHVHPDAVEAEQRDHFEHRRIGQVHRDAERGLTA